MKENSSLAYSEIYEILKLIEDEYVNRIPKKIMSFFEEERDKEYKPRIDVNIPLDEQNLKRETMVLLAILNVNYWCDSEEEKQEIINEMTKNEKKKRELEEKYNPDNLFKNKRNNDIDNDNIEETKNVSLIEYKKQGIFKRILEKITRLFKKN